MHTVSGVVTVRSCGLDLVIPSGVVIPDAYSEFLASRLPDGPGKLAADLTCGGGIHALVLSRGGFTTVAVDTSPVAVAATAANAERNALDVDGRVGSLYEPLGRQRFDVLVAWPPVMPLVGPAVDRGGDTANFAGVDGLEVIRKVFAGARAHMRAGGRLFTIRPWYHDAAEFERLAAAFGLVLRTRDRAWFPLGRLSGELLPDLCSRIGLPEADVREAGQEMTVVELVAQS